MKNVKPIFLLFMIYLLTTFSCKELIPITNSNENFTGTWFSETFETKGIVYYFKVEFHSLYNYVELEKYCNGNLVNSIGNYYHYTPKSAYFMTKGRKYYFRILAEGIMEIHYNGEKIIAKKQ